MKYLQFPRKQISKIISVNNLILFLFIAIAPFVRAQFNFEYAGSIPVKIGSDTLDLAWGGGLNNAQFSDFDFDFDGDMDLFIFDRSSDEIRVFTQEVINGQKKYRLAYNAHQQFPVDIKYRATMVDYNNDGKKDLFTAGIGGVKVYKNVGDAINGLQWVVAKELIYSDNWGAMLNLYVSTADIPAFVDVEGDGDIDVLTFHISGEHLQYHQNQSIELYGIPDSLEFVLKNECWGGFREDINNSSVYLNDNTLECTTGNLPGAELPTSNGNSAKKPSNIMPKHSGSTVLAIDIDNSGVLDLVLGDVAFPNLNLLTNGGSAPNTNSLMISADMSFPSNSQPVSLHVFPAPFWVDVDFDGKKDLIVGTNARNVSENETSILFYKNLGTNSNPTFVYQTNAFLQNEMIEHGFASIPQLVDLDQDGLKDLIVSNFFTYKPTLNKESKIAFYKNTGTLTNPIFSLIDDDFLNLSTSSNGLRLTPAFGDLDNDGDLDMFLGLENGTLSYYQNNSVGPTITFAPALQNYQDNSGTIISSGQYASPQLFDINQDGLLDLIIGKKTGELMYYKNVGSANAPSFTLHNPMLGNIDVATSSPDGYPVPHFFRQGDSTYLFLGSVDGKMKYYNDIDTNLNPGQNFHLVSGEFLNMYTGAYSSFCTDDIDNDGFLDLFVGQDLGGVYHLEVDPNSTSALEEVEHLPEVIVYPNPTNGLFFVQAHNHMDLTVQITDLYGQIVIDLQEIDTKGTIDLTNQRSGIYLCILKDKQGNQWIKKVLKQ